MVTTEKKIKKLQEWTTKDLHMRKEVKLKKGTLVEPSDCVVRENLGQGVVLSYTFSQYEVLFSNSGKTLKFFSTGLRKVSDKSVGPDWKMKKPNCPHEQDVLEEVG